MKYILPIILMILITGCSDKGCSDKGKKEKKGEETNKTVVEKPSSITKPQTIIIDLNDTNLTFKENNLTYPKKRVVLLFADNSKYSKEQAEILKKMKLKYYKTDNEYLKKYFKIQKYPKKYPTIIILDKNKTIRFENLTPYEFLKEAF